MKTYINTLFPWRWVALAALLVPFLMIGIFIEFIHPITYTIVTIITIFVLDLTIGIGRSVLNPWRNLLGIIYLVLLISFIIAYFPEELLPNINANVNALGK